MNEVCTVCGGAGFELLEQPGGGRVVRDCACRRQRRAEQTLARTGIPKRYEHCTLDNFDTDFADASASIEKALILARGFIRNYRSDTSGNGLLLTGSIGTGKTHLASGILKALILDLGAEGLFCDYRELLKQVQHTYNPQVRATELGILAPVFEAEVLVLDELGAAKPTDWVWDTVAQILNTRYNERRTTIITTNYANAGPLGSALDASGRAAKEETLGDRIGERMRSRLQEMCVVVDMQGPDYRNTVKRAQFGVRTDISNVLRKPIQTSSTIRMRRGVKTGLDASS